MSRAAWLVEGADVADPADLRAFLVRAWHAETVVAHGELLQPATLPGFVVRDGGAIVGHAAYRIGGTACELVSIAADPPGTGIGSVLFDAVLAAAREAGCASLWLTTTNDNLDALRFYQRRGMRLVALRAGAVAEARRLKPQVPDIGANGIPLRDELDLAIDL